MRLAMLEDIEKAIEAAGPGVSTALIRWDEWGRILGRLGSLEGDAVTIEILATSPATEFGIFEEAQETLMGKAQSREKYLLEAEGLIVCWQQHIKKSSSYICKFTRTIVVTVMKCNNH